jgi:hypothetical protein
VGSRSDVSRRKQEANRFDQFRGERLGAADTRSGLVVGEVKDGKAILRRHIRYPHFVRPILLWVESDREEQGLQVHPEDDGALAGEREGTPEGR